MKIIKANLPAIALCVLELLVGILLLIRPLGFTSLIILLAGAFLAVNGLILLVKYFRTAPAAAEKEQSLAKGLLALIAGVFFLVNFKNLSADSPLLTTLYGAALLIVGVYKLQCTADILRAKKTDWLWMGIGTLLALIFSVLIFLNPFPTPAALWYFIAASLCAESVTDILYLIFHLKKTKSAPQPAENA